MELMEIPLIIRVDFVRFVQPAHLVPLIALLVAKDYIYLMKVAFLVVQEVSLRIVLIIHVLLVMPHAHSVQVQMLITV
jgi:hypothetical protein